MYLLALRLPARLHLGLASPSLRLLRPSPPSLSLLAAREAPSSAAFHRTQRSPSARCGGQIRPTARSLARANSSVSESQQGRGSFRILSVAAAPGQLRPRTALGVQGAWAALGEVRQALTRASASSSIPGSTRIGESDVIMSPASDILQFWFGEAAAVPLQEFEGEGGKARTLSILAKQGLWFTKSQEIDLEITTRFAPLIKQGKEGALAAWEETPLGALALVILLDQFPRNAFRGQPAQFEADPAAVQVAQRAIARGFDLALPVPMRLFVYMPFMHSEDLAISAEGVKLFSKAAEGAEDPKVKGLAQGFANYAEQHRVVIAQYGRFPHRNSVLGRHSTEEEIKYLEAGGGFA